MDEKNKRKRTSQQGELMRVLDITPDDLLANNEGIITDHQRASVIKRQSYQWSSLQVIAGALGLIGLVPIYIMWREPEQMIASLTFAVLFFGLAGLFIVLKYRMRYNIENDLNNNLIGTAQGIAVVHLNEDTPSHLEINGIILIASKDILRRIRHLEPYMIHYLPKSKIILSMESIQEADKIPRNRVMSRLQEDHYSLHNYPDALSQSALNY